MISFCHDGRQHHLLLQGEVSDTHFTPRTRNVSKTLCLDEAACFCFISLMQCFEHVGASHLLRASPIFRGLYWTASQLKNCLGSHCGLCKRKTWVMMLYRKVADFEPKLRTRNQQLGQMKLCTPLLIKAADEWCCSCVMLPLFHGT